MYNPILYCKCNSTAYTCLTHINLCNGRSILTSEKNDKNVERDVTELCKFFPG